MTIIGSIIFQYLKINYLNLNCYRMRASFEYDYDEDEIDEDVIVHKVPQSQQCPLNLSRFKEQNMSSHRKVLMDLQKFIQDSKNKENQKIQEYKQRQKNIGEIVQRQQKDKQQKIKKLQELQKNKIHNQCPFKPSLQTNNGPRRKFNEFIQHQYAHSQKVMEKKKQMKKNIEEKKDKATHRPKINSSNKSRRQSRSSNNTVFERLYNLREKEKEEISDENLNDTKKLFHPTINERSKNMQREGPVDELLYNDAQRRQEKQKQNMYTSFSVNSKIQKSTSYTNNKYAAQKFIKQFFFVLEDLKIDSSNKAIIEYVMFNELLKEMGFVTNEQEQQTKASSIERALVHDAYQILQKYQVNAHNVCVFLLGLLGIYNIYPVDFEDGDQPLLEKQFNLDESSGRKLQKHFDLFYRNRLSSEFTRKNEQKAQSYSFQPQINKQSVQMAQKHRQMMLDQASQLIQAYPQLQFAIPEDGVISHTDLLVLHKMAKDLEKQVKKQQLEDKELQGCTFKPSTISSMTSMNASKMSENNLGSKKSHELYNFHKNLQSKKESLQYSRTQEGDPQCTFAPQINKNKPLKHPIAPVSKQTQETLYRMHKGRQEYEEKRNFLERGQKTKSRKTSLKSEPQVPACLVLQVKLENKKDNIHIYKGDENRLEQIAHEFAVKHNLPSSNQLVLLEMMQCQLEKVLDKIDEDEESEDCQY